MKRFFPALIWMAVIFYFSSRSTAGVISSDPTVRLYVFKSFHLIEYAILGILLFYGFVKYRWSIVAAYLYAVSDEIHQVFTTGRSPRFADTLIDLVGICLGLLVIKYLLRLRKWSRLKL